MLKRVARVKNPDKQLALQCRSTSLTERVGDERKEIKKGGESGLYNPQILQPGTAASSKTPVVSTRSIIPACCGC